MTPHSDRPGVLRSGLSLSGLDLDELWFACIALGDSMSRSDLEAALDGRLVLSDYQHDIVAQALNDRLVDMGLDHLVPYSREIGGRA